MIGGLSNFFLDCNVLHELLELSFFQMWKTVLQIRILFKISISFLVGRNQNSSRQEV